MKACQSLISATFAALLTMPASEALAQEIVGSEKPVSGPITTGSVVSFDQPSGVMVIQSAQTGGPITFYGMNKARIETKSGQRMTFADVRPQIPVTVHYSPVDGWWYVGKVIIPEPTAVPVTGSELTGAEKKALNSKAANDGDITTQPGVKARIDDDITTQPAKKDPRDPDITKKADK